MEMNQPLNGFAVQSNIIWEDQNTDLNFIWKKLRLQGYKVYAAETNEMLL